MSAPAMGHLNDDNGDGLSTEDDIPDVVFTPYQSNQYQESGPLKAISGDG